MEEQEEIKTETKEDLGLELRVLKNRIVRLTRFVYSEDYVDSDLSFDMKTAIKDQLKIMTNYAEMLQKRLSIFGKTDEELKEEFLKGTYRLGALN